jgi:hypothetical protein
MRKVFVIGDGAYELLIHPILPTRNRKFLAELEAQRTQSAG